MSYTKTYNETVNYSGSVRYTYNYPASEKGGSGSGTAYYSGSVPVSVHLFVDTSPFDSSVSDCSHSIRSLNGAVVALKSSQVASIAKSADEVSKHVISGFFNMIGSELSQNIASLAAKFKALFEFLMTQSTILKKQQVVMQDDYSRISDRYNKVFQDLDEELEKRIVALDKNVFEISKHVQREQLYSKASKNVAQFLLGINEDEIVQQQLIIANAKARTLEAINGLAQNVVQEKVYSDKVNNIVIEKKCDSGEDNYIPVIYAECSSLSSNMVDCKCFSNLKSSDSTQKVNETVKEYFISNYADSNTENEMKQIDEAFLVIAEREFQDLSDLKSKRVYDVLRKLKEN